MKKNDAKLDNLRHSTSHLLAAAILELYPQAKPTIGPPIEDGFYYDFDNLKVSEEDFPRIEEKMKDIVKSWNKFERIEVTKEEAIKVFKDNKYKKELIEELDSANQPITLYKSGDFVDLCRGGHVEKPNEKIKYFKLLSIAGAYWRGNEKNAMLTRIYGTAFFTKDELDKYLWQQEEAKKRDHRRIGKELQLFTFADDVGPGLPLWMPKGAIILQEIRNWAEETEKKWGYERVRTPHIAKHTLYETSGHLPHYKDDMYPPISIDNEDYYLKGMNCPHHHMIYKAVTRSYKDLPIRLAEYGEVYRYEQSGTLFGLMRVRFIQQNDAHIYCAEDQAIEEFLNVIKLHEYYYNTLGLTRKDYRIVIGLPDPNKKDKYHGDKSLWDKAEAMMRKAIEKSGIEYSDDIGGAAFYGPKIDFNIKSSIGREFSISTNQLDLYMPTRFNLEYTDSDGSKKLVAVIHRAPLGSHERFIGFLIEHFAGAFPIWLSPVQIKIIPVSQKQLDYAKKIADFVDSNGIRFELDDRNQTLSSKIRDAQSMKIPYMIIVGEKEEKASKISLRTRKGEEILQIDLDSFVENVKNKIVTKSLEI
jgi:threonyl-tRNA synthetase